MMQPVPRKIFYGVTLVTACALITLSAQFVLANPRESCNSEGVALWQEILLWWMIAPLLLWIGCFLLPRAQQWLAIAALLLCTLPEIGLRGSICCHESYGEVPQYWAMALLVGYMSYLFLFTGKAFYVHLFCTALALLFLYLCYSQTV